jgi:hypothetical protein
MIKNYIQAPAGQQSFVTIEIPVNDIEEITSMQTAIIDLISHVDFTMGDKFLNTTIFYASELLKSLLPNESQLEKGTLTTENIYYIPENISPEYDKAIRELLTTFRMEHSGISRKKVLENLLKTI